MNQAISFMHLLKCPLSGRPLRRVSFSGQPHTGHLSDSVLVATKDLWYPISGGIPRLLPPGTWKGYSCFCDLYGSQLTRLGLTIERPPSEVSSDPMKQQTSDSFGFKWNSQPRWGLAGSPRDIMARWILAKYGWVDDAHYAEHIRKKRRILDAGTGLGREAIRMSEINPEALVLGLDISESVASAKMNTEGIPNALIVQGDITQPPLSPGAFDFILAEGVLHHTRSTRQALLSLSRLLEPEGEIAFYVYRKKGPVREFCDDFLREEVGKLSPDAALERLTSITLLGKALSQIKEEIEFPAIPLLGIAAGRYSVQRFIYWNFMKCYWNEAYSFEENHLVNFDWYHPRYAHRQTLEEVKKWLDEADLRPIWLREEEAGITVRAIKGA